MVNVYKHNDSLDLIVNAIDDDKTNLLHIFFVTCQKHLIEFGVRDFCFSYSQMQLMVIYYNVLKV